MNDLEKMVKGLMEFDPLAEAEKIVGEKSPCAIGLGFLFMQNQRRQLAELLTVLGDSYMQIKYHDFVALLGRNKFVRVYSEQFIGYDEQAEQYSVWWRPDGVLITAESYDGRLNSSNVYYNWRTELQPGAAFQFTSSGTWHGPVDGPGVWVGHADGREGLFTHLKALQENGAFLPAWVDQPFLWFLNYMETKDPNYDYEAINNRKIAQFPVDVQAAITAHPVTGEK